MQMQTFWGTDIKLQEPLSAEAICQSFGQKYGFSMPIHIRNSSKPAENKFLHHCASKNKFASTLVH
jgi:hypothetical protein